MCLEHWPVLFVALVIHTGVKMYVQKIVKELLTLLPEQPVKLVFISNVVNSY